MLNVEKLKQKMKILKNQKMSRNRRMRFCWIVRPIDGLRKKRVNSSKAM